MSVDSLRRRILCGSLAFTSITLAGCSAEDGTDSKDESGQPDVQLKNCYSESKDIRVIVTNLDTDNRVHHGTHTVPGGFCSDAGPSYDLEAVWTSAGKYRIEASVAGLDTTSVTVTLTENAVREDTATRTISVDDGEITIS